MKIFIIFFYNLLVMINLGICAYRYTEYVQSNNWWHLFTALFAGSVALIVIVLMIYFIKELKEQEKNHDQSIIYQECTECTRE